MQVINRFNADLIVFTDKQRKNREETVLSAFHSVEKATLWTL